MPYHYALIIVAFLGLLNALILYWQHLKVKERPMVCLFGQDCSLVVESKWGSSLGVKNEVFGIGFYLLIIILSLWHIGGSAFIKLNELIFFLSLIATLASTYLLIIQFTALRNYCSWCIFSAVFNYLILITAAFTLI